MEQYIDHYTMAYVLLPVRVILISWVVTLWLKRGTGGNLRNPRAERASCVWPAGTRQRLALSADAQGSPPAAVSVLGGLRSCLPPERPQSAPMRLNTAHDRLTQQTMA